MSKQADVANSAAYTVLRKNYTELQRRLNAEDLVPKLFAQRLIGDYEMQEIQAGKTQLQKSQTLVNSLLRKSGKQFEKFCRVLEETLVFTEFAHSLRSQYEEEKALIQKGKGRGVGKQPVEGVYA